MGINSDFIARQAEATVERYRIIKAGTGTIGCIKAAAATDKLLGTSDELDHSNGEMVDLAVGSVPFVKLGGTVAVGDLLTSDANGQAIATTTTGNAYIGRAAKAGVSGDEIPYIRALGVL